MMKLIISIEEDLPISNTKPDHQSVLYRFFADTLTISVTNFTDAEYRDMIIQV